MELALRIINFLKADDRRRAKIRPASEPEHVRARKNAQLLGIRHPSARRILHGVDAAIERTRIAPVKEEIERVRVPHRGNLDGIDIADGNVAEAADFPREVPVRPIAIDNHLARRLYRDESLILSLRPDHILSPNRNTRKCRDKTHNCYLHYLPFFLI